MKRRGKIAARNFPLYVEVQDNICNSFSPSSLFEYEGWTWVGNASGNYSTSSGYRWTTELEDDDALVSRDWNMRNMTTNPMCLRCYATVEDLMHVFRDCPHSSSLWMRLGWDNSFFWVIQHFRPWVLKNSKRHNEILFLATFWWILKGRNSSTFDSSTLDLNVVTRNVHQDFWEWCHWGMMTSQQGVIGERL
ncbi:hypothetical protein Lal_00037518 [Lupinus albus]|nr:hypothetical protein Lal_00037518 [Lupinus albus]